MEKSDDIELLRQYATSRSDEAFAALVGRHVDLVYSAALRQVRDPHWAQEVAQRVFILLAKKARWMGRGTILTGWLYRSVRFVAAEVLRSENRRRVREHNAMQPLDEPTGDSPWLEIEPLLDEAMAGLSEKDRNVLLLRYFEKRSLKELGDALGIKEDAAQKRVARSLEKLREFFAQRGTVVPAAGLGAALSAFAVQAAPAAVTSSILTAVTTSATGITISALTFGALKLMTTTKKIALVTTAVIAALTVPAVKQWQTAKQLRQENEALRIENQQIQDSQRDLEDRLQNNRVLVEQLQRDTAEVPKLRGEISSLRQANRGPAGSRQGAPQAGDTAGNEPSRLTDPMARMNRGRELQKQGNYAEALQEFLWCFDEGNRDPAFTGVRLSFLLNDIVSLGKKFPPAQEALLSRRDAAQESVLSGKANRLAVFELARLNQQLEEPDKNLALLDQLPADSPSRPYLMMAASDQFLEAKRYKDIVEAIDPEADFFQKLGLVVSTGGAMNNRQSSPQLRETQRRMATDAGSKGVEALAGAGQTDKAKALADKVLQFNETPEALAQLLKHAERAGNSDVTAYLKGKE